MLALYFRVLSYQDIKQVRNYRYTRIGCGNCGSKLGRLAPAVDLANLVALGVAENVKQVVD